MKKQRKETEKKVEVRPLELATYADFSEAMSAAYPDWSGVLWRRETIQRLIDLFPEGQLGVFVSGKLVGCAHHHRGHREDRPGPRLHEDHGFVHLQHA